MQTYRHRVRYNEVDAQYVMFNARYLDVADVAVTEYYRELGWSYLKLVDLGFDPSVVRAEVTYSAPVRFDDEIDVEVTCTKVGTTSFDLAVVMARGAMTVASIALVYVNVDRTTGGSTALPPVVANALRASG